MIDLFAVAARAGFATMHFKADPVLWDEMVARGADVSYIDHDATGDALRPGQCAEMAMLRVGDATIITRRVRSMTRSELQALRLRKQAEFEAAEQAL